MSNTQIGYSLVKLATNTEVNIVSYLPARVEVANVGVSFFDQVNQVIPNASSPTHKLVPRWTNLAPSASHVNVGNTISYNGSAVFVTQTWEVPSPNTAQLYAYLANTRYTVETGGCTVGGATIYTDRESRSTITAAYVLAQANSEYHIPNWKLAPGVFVTLDNATLLAIGTAVSTFVQNCFDFEAELSEGIANGTINTYAQIDDADWPTS